MNAYEPKARPDAVKHVLTISETFEYYLEPSTQEEIEEDRKHADEIGMADNMDDIDG